MSLPQSPCQGSFLLFEEELTFYSIKVFAWLHDTHLGKKIWSTQSAEPGVDLALTSMPTGAWPNSRVPYGSLAQKIIHHIFKLKYPLNNSNATSLPVLGNHNCSFCLSKFDYT